ncbi:hypothetical protein NA56DRAFT_746430 [Hyaloscypha hepaticicola]|uniref:Chromo domain-containing protein n=1 Tax=Hyaloscypha hepaticicola TaxID=2082293 RepID=A0A2J6QDE4_9HELO|nr:hypothetical protein NA56DRAFT_746430 [Hyaloscypha hepaticicola]
MPSPFGGLPTEIQLQIFEYAAKSQLTSRVVEIYLKEGEIYSKTRPPPLLHVCRASREVTLKLYKPWLPQFKGTAAHSPWERRLGDKEVDKLSRLQNVCVSLYHDILLINDKQWSNWDFGPIERANLRRLAVNLGGWFGWLSSRDFYLQFAQLKSLSLFEHGKDLKEVSFKAQEIKRITEKAKNAITRKGSKKRYRAPKIRLEEISTGDGWSGSVDEWITYKYPKGNKFPLTSGRRSSLSSCRGLAEENESAASEPRHNVRRRGRPRREEIAARITLTGDGPGSSSQRSVSARHAKKRSRADFEADNLPQNSRRPRGRPRKVLVINNADKEQIPPPRSPTQRTAEEIFAKIRGYMESFRSPTPEAESARQPAHTPTPEPVFKSPLDNYGWMLEDSPEPQGDAFQEVTPSSTFAGRQVVFCTMEDSSMNVEEIQELTPSLSSPFVDPRVAFQGISQDANANQGRPAQDSDGLAIAEDDDIPTSNLDHVSPASYEVLGHIWSQNDDTKGFPEPDRFAFYNDHVGIDKSFFEMPDHLAEEIGSQPIDAPCVEDEEYTPKQFMAERKTPEGLQFLVQWEDYPQEKDWTWETEAAMTESAPDMVAAWAVKSGVEIEEEKPITVDYIVEKIMGRRKFKGVLHYLVKWKGFEKVKDRTWEPCGRLRVDVPLIVEAFEEKRKK